MSWSAPMRKRADMHADIFHHLSENISIQFQQAIQPKLRQFGTNIQRNVFAGLLPYDNEFVVAFSKQSGLERQITKAITSEWAKEQFEVRQAIVNALATKFHQEIEAIQHIDDAVRVARQALVDKIGESVHAHAYDSVIAQKVQPLVAMAIGKSYNEDIEHRISRNIERVTNIWLERAIMNGFCIDATCIDPELVKYI